MSRCFPFPPPGYEKKPRNQDTDLLTKEKHKEKKHKKEKKDKEKREKKDKKDKERIKDKHREKKDKKEKHKDKKKKEKDKSKIKTSGEKKSEVKTEVYNGQKPNKIFNGDEHTKGTRFVEELDRRIRDEQLSGNGLAKEFSSAQIMGSEINKDVERRSSWKDNIDQDRLAKRENRNNDMVNVVGSTISQNIINTQTSRLVESIKSEKKKDERHNLESFKPDKRKDEECIREKRKDKDKGLPDKSSDKQRHKNGEEKKIKNGEEKKIKNGEEKKIKKKEKEKMEIQEANRKKHIEQANKPNEPSIKDHTFISDVKFFSSNHNSNKNMEVEESTKKRKGIKTNGFLCDNHSRPHKLSRPTFTVPLPMENGRVEPPLITVRCTSSDLQEALDNNGHEKKEQKVNGVEMTRCNSADATSLNPKLRETFSQPPHPDVNTLNQILSVPQMELWPEFDDQDWLFKSNHQLKSGIPPPNVEIPRVWAEAVQMHTVDVCALPYVIPY